VDCTICAQAIEERQTFIAAECSTCGPLTLHVW
jgi:predicted RNA-binding Zn-ribbon protein involved in translation (DUF1610 family)